jgi:catechol 2,3-dioxygenase-like lactoylglutathione lyase family enzyme
VAVACDALDPPGLAQFWSRLLGRELSDATVLSGQSSGFDIEFVPTSEMKTGQNRIHFDLTSTSPEDQNARVRHAIELGAREVDVGQRRDEGHVVLADPEDNEFCVIEAGNRFLAGTDLIGAVNCDGTRSLGYFWSAALEWPLVWDENEETAIQAPHGGSKLTWSGPPLMPRQGRDRLRLVVSPLTGDLSGEIEKLVSLGAALVSLVEDGHAILTDPDGNDFEVV